MSAGADLEPKTASTPAARGPYLRVFFATLVTGLVGMATTTVLVDPLARFGTGLVEPTVWLDRDEKCGSFLATTEPAELVVLGSSRIMKANPETLRTLTGQTTFNFAVSSGQPDDFLAMYRFAVAEHRTPHTLFVSVDSDAFRAVPIDQRLLVSPYLGAYVEDRPSPLRTLGGDLFSAQVLYGSARAVLRVVRPSGEEETAEFGPDGFLHYVVWERQLRDGTFDLEANVASSVPEFVSRFAGFERLEPRRIAVFRALLEAARANGTSVVAFVVPLHPDLERALATTTFPARARDTTAMVASLEQEGLLEYVPIADLDTFGGSRDMFFDGAHMREENIERLLTYVVHHVAH